MRNAVRLALFASLLGAAAVARAADTPVPPPATRVAVVRDTLHGVVFEDPYRWLEDKGSPETRAWVQSQMAWTQYELGRVPGRDAVRSTIARFTRLDARSQPSVQGGRLFFTSRDTSQQQAVLVMRESADGPDVVLVDPNPLSPDHTVSVSLVDASLDGRLVAYGVRQGGEDETVVKLLDVATRTEVPGGLPKARYFGVAIDAQKQGCWYSRWEAKGSRVWYHRFGDAPEKDTMVFGDGLGPVEIPYVQLSENGRWVMVTVFKGSSSTDTRIWVRAADSHGAFASVTDTLHTLVNATFAGDQLVIRTDWKAPKLKLFVTSATTPGPSHWKELVPERADATLESYSVACGRVFAKYLVNVLPEIRAFDLDGRPYGTVALPGPGNAGAPQGEWDGKDAYYSFASFNVPTTTYRWNASTGASSVWWRSPAPMDPEKYEVKQEWATSADGTKVPMFVVAPKGLLLDGSHPVLMLGYGGFNQSQLPSFSARIASWLELGGVFVLTNLRGGGEFGEPWHRGGMLANKQHTFDDFIASGQWLVNNRYCTPKTLAIMGGSNGGLLVGAAMTQRPDLFGAVLCEIPLLDMLRYHQFLIARYWIPEYGSSEDATQFEWLRAYSPYQHVKSGVAYPTVMFVSGDSDTRVDPLHARKMTARMQALGGPNPVLLHYDLVSGHSGGKSADQTIEDLADEMQFLRGALGMAK